MMWVWRFHLWVYRHKAMGRVRRGDRMFTCVGPCESNDLLCRLSRIILWRFKPTK